MLMRRTRTLLRELLVVIRQNLVGLLRILTSEILKSANDPSGLLFIASSLPLV